MEEKFMFYPKYQQLLITWFFFGVLFPRLQVLVKGTTGSAQAVAPPLTPLELFLRG